MEPRRNQGGFHVAGVFILLGVALVEPSGTHLEPSGTKVEPRRFASGRGVFILVKVAQVEPSGSNVGPSGTPWDQGGTQAVFACQGFHFAMGGPGGTHKVEPMRFSCGRGVYFTTDEQSGTQWNRGGTKAVFEGQRYSFW